MISKEEIILETYNDMLDVLETSKFFIYNDKRYSAEYLAGYQASFDTIIDYIKDIVQEIHDNNGTQ